MPHATISAEEFTDFVSVHRPQLVSCGVPERYWGTLFQKLKNEIFDAGESFAIAKVEEEDEEEEEGEAGGQGDMEVPFTWQVMVTKEDGISVEDSSHIYLVDHAWTYRVDKAREQLNQVPGLLLRMAALMDIEVEGKEKEKLVEEVFEEMWKYNQTYSIGNATLGTQAAVPIWYIMDEFGAKIQHSDEPSFKAVPFCYVPKQISFTIIWPLKDLEEGDEVTRDYLPGTVVDPLMRKAKLLPWQSEDMSHLSFQHVEEDDAFFAKYKVHETLPNLDMTFPGLSKERNVKVFTDVPQFQEYLTDPRFELVEEKDDADIWWTRQYLKDFKNFSEATPGKYISQFPFEMVLTVKDLLAVVARRATSQPTEPTTLQTYPKWLQTTYNMETELPKFVSYFQQREEKGLENLWICKPWNLTRGIDIHITNSLDRILRLPESGPKIACKYIEDPVLLHIEERGMVKFDLRFILMLQSTDPVRMYVHNNFMTRLAKKPYSADNFEDFEKHMTVMKYLIGDDDHDYDMIRDEFIGLFESQYPDFSWSSIQNDVYSILRDVIQAATSQPPPKGLSPSPQSRAIYGVDMILKWDVDEKGEKCIQPVLLEMNFGPDMSVLCSHHPDFMNDVFSALFLEDLENRPVNVL